MDGATELATDDVSGAETIGADDGVAEELTVEAGGGLDREGDRAALADGAAGGRHQADGAEGWHLSYGSLGLAQGWNGRGAENRLKEGDTEGDGQLTVVVRVVGGVGTHDGRPLIRGGELGLQGDLVGAAIRLGEGPHRDPVTRFRQCDIAFVDLVQPVAFTRAAQATEEILVVLVDHLAVGEASDRRRKLIGGGKALGGLLERLLTPVTCRPVAEPVRVSRPTEVGDVEDLGLGGGCHA